MTEVKRVGAITIGKWASVGHETVAACLLQGHAPRTDAARPICFHLWIGILLEWIWHAFTDNPVCITRCFSVCIIKEHMILWGGMANNCSRDMLLGQGKQRAHEKQNNDTQQDIFPSRVRNTHNNISLQIRFLLAPEGLSKKTHLRRAFRWIKKI